MSKLRQAVIGLLAGLVVTVVPLPDSTVGADTSEVGGAHGGGFTLSDAIVIGTLYHPFFRCVRRHESDRGGAPFYMGGARAENPTSTASGHYQWLDSSWRAAWQTYAKRSAPTARAAQASTYDQSLIAGLAFIKGGASHWRGTHCGYGT